MQTSATKPYRADSAAVIDLFCGAGGLSHGFHLEGFPVAAGIDVDERCRYPYESNNAARFVCEDVARLPAERVDALYPAGKVKILVGCAPCQPFSAYNQKNSDPQWRLLQSFAELIRAIKPDIVSMENVPGLAKFKGGRVFGDFRQTLDGLDYHIDMDTLYGPDYGLPQTRSRLVLLASRLGPIALPPPTHGDGHVTVREAIGHLPAVDCGETDARDPLHRAVRLTDINMKRIRASKPGGTWRDWKKGLLAKCHTHGNGKKYLAVYGRMVWDKPAPTITTQFFGFGNGRFGHPEQNRALTLREGAILQGFPADYQFVEPNKPAQFSGMGKMIGNAVPVVLGRAIARAIKRHLEESGA